MSSNTMKELTEAFVDNEAKVSNSKGPNVLWGTLFAIIWFLIGIMIAIPVAVAAEHSKNAAINLVAAIFVLLVVFFSIRGGWVYGSSIPNIEYKNNLQSAELNRKLLGYFKEGFTDNQAYALAYSFGECIRLLKANRIYNRSWRR